VLGGVGRNFAAGMSGGVAFVLDDDGALARRANLALVELGAVDDPADRALLRELVARHAAYTGSARARLLLDDWEAALPRFVRVMPVEYKRVLEQRERARQGASDARPATQNTMQPTARSGESDGRSEGVPADPARGSEPVAGGRADHHLAGVLRAEHG
jgi:glutamate synthase (NADPH) large chain